MDMLEYSLICFPSLQICANNAGVSGDKYNQSIFEQEIESADEGASSLLLIMHTINN
jgi:hypothetical protein